MAINWYFLRTDLATKQANDYTDIGRERIAMFANRQNAVLYQGPYAGHEGKTTSLST